MNSIKEKTQTCLRSLLDGLVRYCAHGALEKRAEGFVQLFENQIPEKSRILDLGGGWGFYDKPLRDRGHEHLVVDVVRPGYQKAPVVIYDGSRIPFPDRSFDVTLLVTVLHHVTDPEALLKEVRRVTRWKVVLIEDLYHHGLGRLWTICRDRMLNLELLDHPHQFRKQDAWTVFFRGQGFEQESFRKIYTWLAGFRILNGLYIFNRTETGTGG